MIINVKTIKDNLKVISSLMSDFVYLDVENNALYESTDKQAIKILLNISDVKDTEKKIYSISKSDFIHTMEFATDSLTLTEDYRYVIENKNLKGMFEHNDDYNVVNSIKVMFDHSDEYVTFMTMDSILLDKISRGSIFVNPSDIYTNNRYLDIKEKKIFSNSDYRIYINDINIEEEGIIPSDVLKYVQNFGIGCVVKNNNNSYLITDSENQISMYISTETDVDYLPVLSDKFKGRINDIMSKSLITINCKDFAEKLNYMSFYAQKSPSNLGYITIENNEMFISTDEEHKVKVEISSFEDKEMEIDEFKIPCNLVSILNIINKLGKEVETIKMYASKDNNFKLFMFKFGDSEESVILAKLNA